MAIALIVLAVGSVAAGYVGIPNAIVHGGNRIEAFLAPSFRAPGSADVVEEAAHDVAAELSLMGVSTLVGLAGIGLATFLFLKRPDVADQLAARFGGLHRLLSGKYFVDELYDGAIVQPIKRLSAGALWKGVDTGVIDGTVNGVGLTVRMSSAVLRRVQTGSVRAYAMALMTGVVAIVGYYLWR